MSRVFTEPGKEFDAPYRNRLGDPVAERFTISSPRRVGDRREITWRDNLTGDEMDWWDYSDVKVHIKRWMRRQRRKATIKNRRKVA